MNKHCSIRFVVAFACGLAVVSAVQPAIGQVGACCEESVGCIDFTQTQCNNLGGQWLGTGTSCADNDCDFGACCLGPGVCQDMIKGFCDLQGGAFQNGAFCGSNPCGGGGEEGACCAGTFCYQDTQENCEGAGRDFFGGPCEPSPCGGTSGACCTAEGCGSGLTQSECDGIGGLFLPNTSCTATTCDVGACCLEEGCQDVIQSVCNSMGGTWIVDSSCIDDACGIGACCAGPTPTSGCSMDTRLNCESFGRTFLGVDTVCSPNPCGVLSVVAACCTLEGCVELNQVDCAASGGTFVASSSNCGPQTCVVGACCFEEGSCVDLIPSDCANLGGNHNPSGLCSQISCPPAVLGACCIDLEPGAICIQALRSDCEAGGRIYIGDGISCASSPCRTCSTCDGDVNNSNGRDGQDVSAFVECIISSGGAPGFVPTGCDCADMNHDFSVAMDDVEPLVNALLNTSGSCP